MKVWRVILCGLGNRPTMVVLPSSSKTSSVVMFPDVVSFSTLGYKSLYIIISGLAFSGRFHSSSHSSVCQLCSRGAFIVKRRS